MCHGTFHYLLEKKRLVKREEMKRKFPPLFTLMKKSKAIENFEDFHKVRMTIGIETIRMQKNGMEYDTILIILLFTDKMYYPLLQRASEKRETQKKQKRYSYQFLPRL